MPSATATLQPSHTIGLVRPQLFGAFVEHMGRGVYGGIYERGHPAADADGFRTDVLELVSELGVTQVRYPGGNFVSGYRWEDGVGPREQRPTRLDLAWHSRETNAFGLGEFVRWTRAARVAPMLTLNLGTRGLQEALDLLEYANHPAGTELSDRRVRHGDTEPYAIRTWCLGNELDGPWQLGHKAAAEYARLAAETARGMRQFDPSLRLVVAGSSASTMPTFGSWERTVLESCWELVDEISVHAYFEEGDDLGSFLASGVAMDAQLDAVAGIADDVVAAAGGSKRIGLAVDEWNVWYMRRHQETFHPGSWPVAPVLCEDAYSVADAVVVGGLLISLLRHADTVSSACLAQLVNTIAPIKTAADGSAWREATFHPFAITARHARGTAVRLEFEAPAMATADHGDVPVVDGVATMTDDGTISLFLLNRHPREALELSVRLDAERPVEVRQAQQISDPDPHAANDASRPHRVRPVPVSVRQRGERALQVDLPPVCWAHIQLRAEPDSVPSLR
jgi:alpha-N-arabinofuranosidase